MNADRTPPLNSRRLVLPGALLLITVGYLALVPAGFADAGGVDSLDPQERRTFTDLHLLITAIEAYQQERGQYPGPTAGYTGAEFLRPLLEQEFVDAVPLEDAWGQAFLYGFDGQSASVVSFGANGVADLDYSAIVTTQAADAGDDLVWTDNRLLHYPEHLEAVIGGGAQKATMGDIRSIAIAVESYKLDNGGVPGPTEGDGPVAYLRPFVQPIYIRALPITDGWDHAILYWSDGEHYRIVSNGRDGVPDGPYGHVEEGSTISNLDGDIIFTDARFIQFPVGPQR